MPRRDRAEVAAAAQAAGALAITQAALRFLRFQTVRRVLLRVAQASRLVDRRLEAGTLIWAVKAAARRCPLRSTCLGEALVAEALLRRHGYTPVLCIGAARSASRFQAHAWLEMNDGVIIGGPASVIEQYTRFPEISSLAL